MQEKLQRTEWVDVHRISPAQMPHTFVLPLADMPSEPIGLFRLVRIPC